MGSNNSPILQFLMKLGKRCFKVSKPKFFRIMFYDADKDRGHSLTLGLNEQVVFRSCLASECWVLNLFLASIINFLKFEFSLNLLKHSYVKSVINSVQPKLIYCVTYNDRTFWKLKADFPDIVFVLIRNGIHGFLTISHQHETNTQMFKDLKVENLAVMSAVEINWYKKNLLESGKVLLCGSVKNNHVCNISDQSINLKNNEVIYLPQFKDLTFESGTKIFTKYYNIDNPKNFIPYQNLYGINQSIKIPSH